MRGRLGILTGLGALALAATGHAAPAPPPRLPAPPSVRTDAEGPRLRRHDDGTLRHVDAEGRFVGIVHEDGRVEVRELPDVTVEFTTGVGMVDWMLGLAHAVARPGAHDRPDLEAPPPDREDKTRAGVQLTPPSPYGPPPIMISAGGRFGGVADLALRAGQRRHTRRTQAFLESTASLRAARARSVLEEQRRTAQARLGRELAALWHDRSRSPAERRRALFERWDECEEAAPGQAPAALERDEEGSPARAGSTDDERALGGEAMRRRIEAFIRVAAPAGSAQGFDAAELARLNAARHSRQRFDPYGRVPDATREGSAPARAAR
jgi:hypothetical protein